MSDLTFNQLMDQTTQGFARQAYAETYDLVTREGERFPEQAYWVWYIRACLAARLDQLELAEALLDEAREQGLWYSEHVMRATPSFPPLQGRPAFEQLVTQFSAMHAAAQTEPLLRVAAPESGAGDAGFPTLLALHGNGANAQEALDQWQPLVAQGWLVAAAQGSQIITPNAYVWDDREIALREIGLLYETLQRDYPLDPSRLVIGGFSMGGETAVWLALSGALRARGFIVVGPGGGAMDRPDEWLPLVEQARERGLRGYIIEGEADNSISHEGIARLADLLNANGVPCHVEKHPALAHAFPPDAEQALARALAFVLPS